MHDVSLEVSDAIKDAMSTVIDSDDASSIMGMGADGTPTSRLDKVADDAALGVFEDKGDIRVVSEESGATDFGDPLLTVALDPLDGSHNALIGLPFYSVSMAYSETGRLEDVFHACVVDLERDTFYEAIKDEASYIDGDPVNVSDATSIEDMTACGVYRIQGFDPTRFRRVRLLGCSSLELCYLGSGAVDAFVDVRGYLRSMDFAAGKLFIEEAGGKVTDREGNPVRGEIDPNKRSPIIASNREGHPELIEMVSNK